MNEVIELSFRYSAAEVSGAMRSHYAFRLHPRRDLIIAAGLFSAGVYLWRSAENQRFGLFFIGVACFFVLIQIGAFIIVPLLAFRLQPKFRDEYSLTFAQEGIHFRTAHIDAHIAWRLYSSALVDRNVYLLYYGLRSFTIVPKRVFTGPEQLNAFEELLRRQVGKIVDKN